SELVQAAYDARPAVSQFVELYRALGLASDISLQHAGVENSEGQESSSTGQQLPTGMADIGRWRERLTMVEGCVCRIETGATGMGTAFLVAPDIVMTAFHNVRPIFDGVEKAENVRVRFDYRVLADGRVTPGLIVGLRSDDWDVDHSPFAPDDAR